MIVWDTFNFNRCHDLIIFQENREDIKVAVDDGYFLADLSNVFVLSHSARGSSDFVTSIFSMHYNNDSSGTHWLNELDLLLNKSDYISAIDFLLNYKTKAKSEIEKKVVGKLASLLSLLNTIKTSFLNDSPFLWGSNWIDSSFNNEDVLKTTFDKDSIRYCPIEKYSLDAHQNASSFFSSYNNSTPHRKLAHLAAYWVFSCDEFVNMKDYTKATVFLHRAIETLYISWLVEDHEIHLGRDGLFSQDKHFYLTNYKDKVKISRSVSNIEDECVSTINELRNFSKYAHGYCVIKEADFSLVYQELRKVITEDVVVKAALNKIDTVNNIGVSICGIIVNYLLRENYVEKLY